MIPLVLQFYKATEKPEKPGLKFSMLRLEDLHQNLIGYDWGYADFNGEIFLPVIGKDMTGHVVKWCELPDPKLLF